MNDFQETDPPASICANCGGQIRQLRYGDALVWEHIQRPVTICTDDRGEPLGPEVYATPAVNWSAEDLDFLAVTRIKP